MNFKSFVLTRTVLMQCRKSIFEDGAGKISDVKEDKVAKVSSH